MAPTQVYIYEEEDQDPEEGLGDFSSSCLRLKNRGFVQSGVLHIYNIYHLHISLNRVGKKTAHMTDNKNVIVFIFHPRHSIYPLNIIKHNLSIYLEKM